MTRRGTILFALMCVIWGVPYLLIKVAVRDLSPAALVFARTGIGSLVLVPIAAARGELIPVLRRWKPLLAYTVIEIAGPWLMLSSAEKRLSSSLSGLLVATVPLVGVVLSRMFRDRERIDSGVLGGLVIGLLGVVAVVGLDVGGSSLGAVAMVAVVVVGYAAGPIIIARSLTQLPGLGVVAASLALCAIGYAPFAALSAPSHMPGARVLAAVLTLGLVCTALAFVLFFHLIAEIGPLRATVITYVNPAVALTLGVVFLGESFGIGTALGFTLILVGSYLSTRRRAALALAAP